MTILPECEPGDNVVEVDFAMRNLEEALRRASERGLKTSSFQKREERLLALSNEAVRRCLEADLQTVADSHTKRVEIDGKRFKRHQSGTVCYHSLCGPLTVKRWSYREEGVRNGPTSIPMELATGIIERSTPGLAFALAQGHAMGPVRHFELQLRAAHREPPSRSTLERMAVAIGTSVKQEVKDVEPALRRAERLPLEAVAVSLGLDRTTIPMEEALTLDTVAVRYRMAYVATIAMTNQDGEVLQKRQYAAAAHEGPDGILSRLFADLKHALRERPALNLGVIQDGAPELWNRMRDWLGRTRLVQRWTEVIDRYHVDERLGLVAQVIEPDAARRGGLRERWKHLLDTRERAMRTICKDIDRLQLTTTKRREILPHISYLDGYEHMIRYPSLRKLGLPMRSGVTEGACKSLITMRTKRSGQRWRPPGIDALLALRSIQQSDRLPRFWKSFSRRHQCVVQAA